MSNIIDFEAKRKQKAIEKAEMEKVTKMMQDLHHPSHVGLWVSVVFLAFIPWMTYFFVLWAAKSGLTPPQMLEVKFVGAAMAVIFSPLVTFVAAQIVYQEYKNGN